MSTPADPAAMPDAGAPPDLGTMPDLSEASAPPEPGPSPPTHAHWATTDFNAWASLRLRQVEAALETWVGPDCTPLCAAMRYAVLDGGKRLRPLLLLASAEAVGLERSAQGAQAGAAAGSAPAALGASPSAPELPEPLLRAACAVEIVHAYSLAHDDLPCMDNDVLRRGKPTLHVRYGYALALLAGDALQALAFELLLQQDDSALAAQQARLLAHAAGPHGMAGGQAIDLLNVGLALSQAELEHMHRLKTGALLLASVQMGALAAAADERRFDALTHYGRALGLAFQVIDDVLDVVSDSATLGKTVGKDAAAAKPTFVSLLGLDGARRYAADLLEQAHAALNGADLLQPQRLHDLADWVVRRQN